MHKYIDHSSGAALDDLGARAYLDAILLSSEEGIEKPAREMFLRACARLGVQPSEAVHVGDELPACVAPSAMILPCDTDSSFLIGAFSHAATTTARRAADSRHCW